ncbi:MAG: peptidoglycan recognition family protein [Planctomycetota bacterium]
MRIPIALTALAFALILTLAACRSGSKPMPEELAQLSIGQHIVVAGERVYVGAPVILWDDPNGYDAYQTTLHFGPAAEGATTPADGELRYKPGRTDPDGNVRVAHGSNDLLALQGAVDMFVVHYDVCGISKQCFKVLQDRRGLSVQFMIDIDGTIYQTMDLVDTAWHARQVNWRSVGVEMANIGSYALTDKQGLETLESWYPKDDEGHYLKIPKSLGDPLLRVPAYVGRPARPERIVGPMQGSLRAQYDYTPEQYDSLVRLTATLCKTLPRIEPDAPRDAAGRVLTARMPEEQEAGFRGIVGHHHVSEQKQDPGPAFDWEVFLARVKARLSAR